MLMRYWILYEVNQTDTAGTTDRGIEWAKEFESFKALHEAVEARNEMLRDTELYRNVSPILTTFNDPDLSA